MRMGDGDRGMGIVLGGNSYVKLRFTSLNIVVSPTKRTFV